MEVVKVMVEEVVEVSKAEMVEVEAAEKEAEEGLEEVVVDWVTGEEEEEDWAEGVG